MRHDAKVISVVLALMFLTLGVTRLSVLFFNHLSLPVPSANDSTSESSTLLLSNSLHRLLIVVRTGTVRKSWRRLGITADRVLKLLGSSRVERLRCADNSSAAQASQDAMGNRCRSQHPNGESLSMDARRFSEGDFSLSHISMIYCARYVP